MEPKRPATAKKDRKPVKLADLKARKDPKGGAASSPRGYIGGKGGEG